jgi:Rab-GTPase-TBC domain
MKHCPALAAHLTENGVSLGMFSSRWFVTLFQCHDVFG